MEPQHNNLYSYQPDDFVVEPSVESVIVVPELVEAMDATATSPSAVGKESLKLYEEEKLRFEGRPNRREAIKGRNKLGEEVFLILGVAKRDFDCSVCEKTILWAREYIVVQTLHSSRVSVQHVHKDCATHELIPKLKSKKIIKDEHAKPGKVNHQARKQRNRQRRQGR